LRSRKASRRLHARQVRLWALAAAPTAVLACGNLLGIEERAYTPSSLCDAYCAEVTETCTGDFLLYASLETCLGTCGRLPEGKEGDTSGNTVECRREQARLAKQTGELSEYCRRAGPGGDGTCGSNCEGFCTLMVPVCGAGYFENGEACLAACAPLSDHHDYRVPAPDEDSVQCRLYHVTSATLSTEHCAHAHGDAKCVEQGGAGGGGGG
jgi:hypothetical protein